jgi:hypothetical protein
VADRHAELIEALAQDAFDVLSHDHGPDEPQCVQAFEALKRRFAKRLRRGPSAEPKHAFSPHPKWPWFCNVCGYDEREPLQHIQSS